MKLNAGKSRLMKVGGEREEMNIMKWNDMKLGQVKKF